MNNHKQKIHIYGKNEIIHLFTFWAKYALHMHFWPFFKV